MSRARVLLIALLALLTTTLAVPASADEDRVRNLDVTFAIQPDGSVLARYELEWRFAEKGRHGIDFGIATRESWDADRDYDAVYRVSDVRVSSPSGAPAQFTSTERGWGSDGSLDLRIGDPDTTLDTRDATYVIEYRIEGALRTFDEGPELYWDVTSYTYPPIESYQVRVTAPDGVTRARCLSDDECTAVVDAEGATFASDDETTRVITVVAGLPEGSVQDAEPDLEPRAVEYPELRELHGHVEVLGDGSAQVEQRLVMDLPADRPSGNVGLDLILRAPWSEDLDQDLTPLDITAHDSTGRRLPVEVDEQDDTYSYQRAELRFVYGTERAEPEEVPAAPSVREEFIVRYRIPGAVGVENGTTAVRLPLTPTWSTSRLRDATMRWSLPGRPTSVQCRGLRYNDTGFSEYCELGAVIVDGTTVTAAFDTVDGWTTRELTDFVLPAGAVESSLPLEPSLDAAKQHRQRLGIGGAAGGGALALALAAGTAHLMRGRDLRWAAPAGSTWPVVGDAPAAPARPTRAAKRSDVVAVRFNPPSVPLHEAGLLLDRRFRPSHLAAVLVSLAVRGVVRLGSKPLMVQRLDSDSETTTIEASVARNATRREVGLPDANARRMRERLEKEDERLLTRSGWFRHTRTTERLLAPLLVAVAPLILFLLLLPVVGPRLREGVSIMLIGLAIGTVVAIGYVLLTRSGPRLTAEGRELLDEVEGFRTYIATAEANQLDWEADRDIFREFLPWAVLFDLTDRWTQVCQTLAQEGRIPQIDTSDFLVGSVSTLGSDLSRFSSGLASASSPPASSGSSSSGGSGGSSGFSGGSSGGGGGGTSASSW